MTSLTVIKENIEANKSMRGLVEVYEEMAAETMRQIREAILSSRDYYFGLARLSAEVGSDLAGMNEGTKKQDAIVLLSADEGMYGDIIDKVLGSFVSAVRERGKQADLFVGGSVGKELLAVLSPTLRYTSIELPKVGKIELALPELVKQLSGYERVEIFFGQFDNIVRQSAMSRVLSSGEIEIARREWAGEVESKLKFLYEPSPAKIAEKFSQEIFSGILEQTIKEGELAKNASRLMHLDQAWGKIEKTLAHDMTTYSKLKKRRTGKKQHIQLSGYIARTRLGRMT